MTLEQAITWCEEKEAPDTPPPANYEESSKGMSRLGPYFEGLKFLQKNLEKRLHPFYVVTA